MPEVGLSVPVAQPPQLPASPSGFGRLRGGLVAALGTGLSSFIVYGLYKLAETNIYAAMGIGLSLFVSSASLAGVIVMFRTLMKGKDDDIRVLHTLLREIQQDNVQLREMHRSLTTEVVRRNLGD